MKKLVIILLLFTSFVGAQVFNDGWKSASLTTVQIQALAGSEGLMRTNSDTKTIWLYSGSAWNDTGASSSGVNLSDAQWNLTNAGTFEFTKGTDAGNTWVYENHIGLSNSSSYLAYRGTYFSALGSSAHIDINLTDALNLQVTNRFIFDNIYDNDNDVARRKDVDAAIVAAGGGSAQYRKPDILDVNRSSATVTNEWTESAGDLNKYVYNRNDQTGDMMYTLNGTFTSSKVISSKNNNDNGRMVFRAGAGFSLKGDGIGGRIDTSIEGDGIYLDSLSFGNIRRPSGVGTVYEFDGAFQVYFSSIFGDFAGSYSFPSSLNDVWTDETTATITAVAGTPTETQVSSINNSGGDFATLDLITPVDGETYRVTGELFYQSGAFAHIQLRQTGGANNKFEGDIANTTTWQSFDFTLAIVGTNMLVLDAPTSGDFKFRNLQIIKL